MGKQSRPLNFRLLSRNISQLQIAYLIPAPHPDTIEPQSRIVLSLPKEKAQKVLMRGDWVGRGGRGPTSHLHTVLWISFQSKMQTQILPLPSHFGAASLLTQHFQSSHGMLPTHGAGSQGWGAGRIPRKQTSQSLQHPQQTRGWGGLGTSWGQHCCFQGTGLDGSLPCLLKHFQLNPVELNLLLLINFPVSLPTRLRTPRRYYSKHNRKGLFFSANFLTEEASTIPPSRIWAIRVHEN